MEHTEVERNPVGLLIINEIIGKKGCGDLVTGGGKDGKTSTANFMQGMLGSIPPLDDIFKSAGMELPDYLKGKTEPEEKKEEEKAKGDEFNEVTDVTPEE